jgi:hypothetical protein
MTSQLIMDENRSKLSDILLKKYLNIPAAYIGSASSLEVPLVNRSYVISDRQLFSDSVPEVAPTDISNDTTFSQTVGQSRKFSISIPHIIKYEKLLLDPIQGDQQYYYTFWSKGTLPTNPKANRLRNTISYNYDPAGSYAITVYINNGSGDEQVISDDSTRPWIFDADSGILTFFNGISKTSTVKITFWRYEGRFGFQSVIADAPKLIFDGGVPSTNFNENVGNVVVISGGGPG